MTKSTDIRETPQDFFDILNEEFDFDIDVCASKKNTKVPDCYITEKVDSFSIDWAVWCHYNSNYNMRPVYPWLAWMNPPYSNIMPWLEKAARERDNDVTTVTLLPASVSSKWFHKWIWNATSHVTRTNIEIRFPTKRLVFGPHFTGAKWPSMVVIFRAFS